MALMEVVLRTEYKNQECINRWNYVASGTPAATNYSFALVHAFGAVESIADSIIDRLFAIMNVDVNFIDIEARDVYSTTDFYTRPFATGVNGENAGSTPAAPFLAFGFRTNRVRTDIRRATKRFVGATEADMTNGGVIEAAMLTLLNGLASEMSSVLTYDDEGNTLSFSPAVAKKEKYTAPSGKDAYRYYTSEATQLDNLAVGVDWQPYETIRSQGSRQYGRGR